MEVAGFQAASVGLVAEYIVAIDVTQFDWRGKSGEVPMKQASARLQALVQTQSPRTESIQPPGKEPALAASLQQLFDMGVLASRLLIKSTHWLRSAKIPQSNQGPYDSKHMLYQLSYSWLAKKNLTCRQTMYQSPSTFGGVMRNRERLELGR